MSATPTTAKTSGKAGKPFAPTMEIKLQGGGGLNPGILEVIKNRQLVFTTDEGTLFNGTVTVRSMYALEIHFNTQERSKIKLMWDISNSSDWKWKVSTPFSLQAPGGVWRE
jgi:hypothetical protein